MDARCAVDESEQNKFSLYCVRAGRPRGSQSHSVLEDRIFRDILQSAPDGLVVVDGGGRIVFINNEVERLFGYAERELLGRPVEVLVPSRLRSVHNIHRSDYLGHPRPRPMGAGLTLMGRRKDGTEFPVEISLSPVGTPGGQVVAAIVRDITERRRAEETIRSQAELLEYARDAIIVLDLDRRIQYWNSGAERTYGWTAEEALGQFSHELLQTSPVGCGLEQMTELLRREAIWEGELEQRAQDGRGIIVASRQTLRRTTDGLPTSILEIDRDITESKRLERERAVAALELQRQQERDRIAMDLHDGVIQSIYAVGLNLEAASQEVEDEPAAARAHIESSIERLQTVIEEIRSYIFALRRHTFADDVAAAIDTLVVDAQQSAGIVVEKQLDRELPALSDDMVTTLYHIAQEAIANTLRHARASRVRVSLRGEDSSVTLLIEDDGVGFDPATVRGDAHNGIRNMTARAEAVGAELALESTPGAGSRIIVRVPV